MSLRDDIILKKTIRKKYLARAKSDPNFKQEVESAITNPDTHPFSDIGDNTGAIILGHNADCHSLDLEMLAVGYGVDKGSFSYQLGPANLFRGELIHKIDPDDYDMMQHSYEKLNAYVVRCVPNEYADRSDGGADPRSPVRDPSTGASLNAHDFRFAGDLSTLFFIDKIKQRVLRILQDVLKDNIDLVPYLKPITLDRPSPIPFITTEIDGKPVSYDIKGNQITDES